MAYRTAGKEALTCVHAWGFQFLVDSKAVYEELEQIVAQNPKLAAFTNTGLERAKPLEKDIAWSVSWVDRSEAFGLRF